MREFDGRVRASVVTVLAVVLALLLPVVPAHAAAPSNDDFANRALAVPRQFGATIDATEEEGEPNFTLLNSTLWYSIHDAGFTGEMYVSTVNPGTEIDTTLAVYTGNALNSLSAVATNDDAYPGVLQSELSYSHQAGTPYHVQVGEFGNGVDPGTFEMTLTKLHEVDGAVKTADGVVFDVGCVTLKVSNPDGSVHYGYDTSGTDGRFSASLRAFTSSNPLNPSTGLLYVYDCGGRVQDTEVGSMSVDRFGFTQASVRHLASASFFDQDIVVEARAAAYGFVHGLPEGDGAPCVGVYFEDLTGARNVASTRVFGSSYELYSLPSVSGSAGSGSVVLDTCRAGFGETQSALDAQWPYGPVYAGNVTSAGAATPFVSTPGEAVRQDFAFPGAVPDLVSYYPGPDGDGKGRLWITDTLTGAQSLATRFGTPTGWQTHAVGDLDGDGTNSMYSYFPGPDGDGKGRWWSTDLSTGAQRLVTRFGTPSGWQTHLTADLDGDGTDELVSYFPGNGTWWRTTVGSDGTARQDNFTTFGTKSGWQTHRVADMNGDGRQEILSYFPGNGTWWQTEIQPDGTARQTRLTAYGTRTGWQEHLVADVTGDSTPELLSYHPGSGRWWQTDVSTSTARQSILVTYDTSASWDTHLVSDQDLDGRFELVSFDAATGKWWRTATNGTSALPRELLTTYGTKTGWQTHLLARTD